MSLGPKGVINDWRKYKQLEVEQKQEQKREMERLIKKLSMTCRSDHDLEKDQEKEKQLQNKIKGKVSEKVPSLLFQVKGESDLLCAVFPLRLTVVLQFLW